LHHGLDKVVKMPEYHSYVVTGGAQGIGRAIAGRLTLDGYVVVLDVAGDLGWTHERVRLVSGNAGDPQVAAEAAALAESAAPLAGWVNNAAIFKDAGLDTMSAAEILDLSHSRPGAIVNVSSHQAQRPVRGALPYATAKAAVEGLTRAVAVDHGPDGIRANAVALGSISTARYEAYRSQHPQADDQMALLHPLGRVGTSEEVAAAVAFLLSAQAGFINGVLLPVDGGRAVNGADPEAS
jgi:NAD(P)-dependent dehydrogenase (short-subunit alcohol dehydrogenase family)